MNSIQVRLQDALTESTKQPDVKITTFEDLQARVKRAEILIDYRQRLLVKIDKMNNCEINNATLKIGITDKSEHWRDREQDIVLETHQGRYMTNNKRITDLFTYVMKETLRIELGHIEQELKGLNVGFTC